MDGHQWRGLVEGIAAFSHSLADMGDGTAEAEMKLIGYLANLPLEKADVVKALMQAALWLEETEDPGSVTRPDPEVDDMRTFGPSGGIEGATPRLQARDWLRDLAGNLSEGRSPNEQD